MQAVDGQRQAAVAARKRGNVRGEIKARRRTVGPDGAHIGIQYAAAIVGLQSQPAHCLIGRGATRAAEFPRQAVAQRFATMKASAYRETIRFAVLKVPDGCLICARISHWPLKGNSTSAA